MAVKRTWWAAVAAALALGMVGPSVADETDDLMEVDGASARSEAMFEFLVAEIAAQRGDTEGALAVLHRLARELKDPQVARRAVETAIRARAFGPALESASLLLELDPESTLAREIMAALLANEGDLGKAKQTLAALLSKNPNRGPIVMQLTNLLAKFPDKAAVLQATQSIAEPYLRTHEAHYAIGVAALVAGQVELASKEADAALAITPAWEPGAILKAQVLRKAAPNDVIPFYQKFVEAHPGSQEVRMQLGRELAAERKLGEAREQFRAAEKLVTNDAQAAYAIGLLSLQLDDYLEAQVAFSRALKQGYREPTSIYLGLGQAAEGLKRYEEAIGWYQKVEAGDWVRAQLKIATLIARQQGLAAGREYLQRIEARSEEDSIQMVQVEAQLLRDAKAWNETYEMLTKAVAKFPESFELLYDRAMAAERIDKLDVLEADLRRVIKMKPDYAHAYNALGYTLADKTQRYGEAKELIEKAYKLSPDDPFILDSLGWVCFRMGLMQEALKHLQTAYGQRPDPEIAAHYGEVLWTAGNRDEAQKVWRAALSENPNHETLLAVMQKHQP